jgi:hypothetical protein
MPLWYHTLKVVVAATTHKEKDLIFFQIMYNNFQIIRYEYLVGNATTASSEAATTGLQLQDVLGGCNCMAMLLSRRIMLD